MVVFSTNCVLFGQSEEFREISESVADRRSLQRFRQMKMTRRLLPYSTIDRLTLALTPFFVFVLVAAFLAGDKVWVVLSTLGLVYIGIAVYVFQDQPPIETVSNDYAQVISSISSLGKQLEDLGKFLERERTRVAATEETIRKLGEEKARLEPVVITQRQTVEAILAAHAARTVRTAWKERLVGFSLGVVASLVASFAFQLFDK